MELRDARAFNDNNGRRGDLGLQSTEGTCLGGGSFEILAGDAFRGGQRGTAVRGEGGFDISEALGTKDIDWKEYEHITSFFAQNKKAKLQFPTIHPTPLLTHHQRYHKIMETLSLWIQKEIPQEVLEALAPTEMLLAKRSKQQDYTAPQEKGKDILTKLLSDIQVHGNIL